MYTYEISGSHKRTDKEIQVFEIEQGTDAYNHTEGCQTGGKSLFLLLNGFLDTIPYTPEDDSE